MRRALLALLVGVGGMTLAGHDGHGKGKVKVTTLSERDVAEKLDGKSARATVVEVTMGPGEGSPPHRHPGPVFGYVLEGEYEIGLDDQPAKTLKAGETFYEPTGGLHRVSRNPAAKGKTRVLAVVLHPRDAGPISTAEPPAKEGGPAVARPPSPTGRWALTVGGAEGKHPSWLEVRQSGYRTLVGTFVGQFGSARPVSRVEYDKGRLRFTIPPQWERRGDDITFEGKLEDGVLGGETTDEKGKRIPWEGRRAPSLKRAQPPRWGEPVELFNGRDLAGWKPRASGVKNGWLVREGLLTNATPGNDLLTERKFADFRLRAEFRYPKGSNSGIYLRGRYEVQIEDNFGEEPECHKIGGVYGFLTPSVNAAKKAGEWQTLEVTLVGREVTIVLNGERIIDRQAIPGITGGALDSDEGKPGPVLIQGDHGPIEFRKVTLTPANDEEKLKGAKPGG